MSSKKLINKPEDAVNESLAGFVATHPNQVRQLDGWPRVIVRSDLSSFRQSGKVALIAGGGSGHEPCFAGFVGKGFLTAAVAGSVFASPPTAHVLAALRAVNGSAGTVVLVINYTGDRLNFGLAAERAKQLHAKSGPVRVVVIGDDTALVSADKSAGRRGIAGALMIMKMASAMADSGRFSTDQIANFATRVGKELGTIGLSLSPCSLPGQGPNFHLEADEMELGLGIHGEPGVRRIKLLAAKETVNEMLSHMTREDSVTRLALEKGNEVAVLINNLGGLSQIEMNIICGEALSWLADRGINIKRIYSGTLMSSLEMQGVSISVLKLSDKYWTCWLDADTECVAWPKTVLSKSPEYSYKLVEPLKLEDLEFPADEMPQKTIAGFKIDEDWSTHLKRAISSACQTLIDAESELNHLDQAAGDGDCGITIKAGAQAVLNAINGDLLAFDQPSTLLRQISHVWEINTGGATGAIYALFLSSAASKFMYDYSPKAAVEALKYGTETVMTYGHAEPGDRTMIDSLNAAVQVLENSKTLEIGDFEKAVESAEKAAESTKDMNAKAGRASYVSKDNLTLPDPGAKAVAFWMRAVLDAYKL